MLLHNWLYLKMVEKEMERSEISKGFLYSRHWARCFLCIIPFNLHFSSIRWCHYPEYMHDETGTQG